MNDIVQSLIIIFVILNTLYIIINGNKIREVEKIQKEIDDDIKKFIKNIKK